MSTRPLLLCVCFGAACDVVPAIDFERMIDQPRAEPYEASRYFEDGRAMRSPPPGTFPHDPVATVAAAGEAHEETIPVPVTHTLLRRGRDRFDIYCAPCHGVRGDGESEVARNMRLRKPPSLLDARIRAFPAGHVAHVVSVGYGLMPSYARDLSVDDRWAVAAYVLALQRSQDVPLDALPPDVRREAEQALP